MPRLPWILLCAPLLLAACAFAATGHPATTAQSPAPVPVSVGSARAAPAPGAPEEIEVPGTRFYTWSDRDARAAVRRHLLLLDLDADAAMADALAWPPPNHPDAAGYLSPPAVGAWTPGGWLVESRAGRWWVIEAYGSVSPADDRARTQPAPRDPPGGARP
jgi:hypothetical protein